jgi:hypothetical protein
VAVNLLRHIAAVLETAWSPEAATGELASADDSRLAVATLLRRHHAL